MMRTPKDDLLFLAHRIPYPPRKGDKIRSYHLLKMLSQRYRVHLGAFVDDDADCGHQAYLNELCGGETHLVWLNPMTARMRALRGLWRGTSLTFPYYDHPSMRSWTRDILQRHAIRRIVVYSAAPAQFIPDDLDPGIRRVVDLVDVDSLKWRQYAQRGRGWMRWLYDRESRTLLEQEKALGKVFDALLFVSEAEANLFKSVAPALVDKIDYWENGVDVDYFSPEREYPNPYAPHDAPLVFTGAMDYWPNVDAVTWFAHEVFPRILEQVPEACFFIVGGRPTQEVLRLQNLPRITVTGQVADVRPWLAWSRAAVAPLRIAQGVQNKILEAMAMARPVLATPAAMEGIPVGQDLQRWVAETPEILVNMAVALLHGEDENEYGLACGPLGRQLMLNRYDWAVNLERVAALVAG
ncbi:MAG: TIGR03087 family PEP-CTERM/XrtA system glycosyltransferase [Magnetococcus sp. YQC-5]